VGGWGGGGRGGGRRLAYGLGHLFSSLAYESASGKGTCSCDTKSLYKVYT